jgi:hypothetical protein
MNLIKLIMSIFTKGFWVQEFPKDYDDKCFMCNESSCEDCSVVLESSEERLINQARCDAGMFLSNP